MDTKRSDKWICFLFCLFLGLMPLLFLLQPKEDFSEREKRWLAAVPELSWTSVASGRFGEEAESYAADHLPGRDFLVGLNAAYDLLSGRQITKDVILGRSGRLYETPAPLDKTVIARNMAAITAFADKAGQPVAMLLVPSAGYVLRGDLPALADPYEDDAILAAAEQAGERLEWLDLLPLFEAQDEPGTLYYRTDHHWTAAGARLAADAYLEARGCETLPASAYTVTKVPGFYGTTWSRAALWALPAEELELWDSGGSFTVENRETEGAHEGLFYREHLAEEDKYPVYLDGNHSLVRIRNTSPGAQGKLLLIRDSFASCLACFLAENYEEIVLVDLRYYRSPVSQLLSEGFDEVLIVYGVKNFMTDANIVRLA